VALALLLNMPAAIAGKPTRSLPRPSASRRAGPESLAHASHRERSHTDARAAKSGKSRPAARDTERRGKSAEAADHSRRHNRRDADRAQTAATKPRDVAKRGRRSRRSRAAARADVATVDQPVRSNSPALESKFGTTQLRATPRPTTVDDPQDSDSAAASAQQAFGTLSPLSSIERDVTTPLLLPNLRVSSLYDSRGRLIAPAPLYGSHEILLHQNEMADHDGLDRIRDDAGLEELLREKKLVALPASEMLEVDDRLPGNRRYSRPWTAAFLSVLARDYYANFHEPIYVTSAVRTIQVQQRLVRTNGNAAGVSGESASPHLTGQAVDIAKKGLSTVQIAWMRTYLQPLIQDGKIDVEEEFRQACFHISVYRSYLPMSAPRMSVATSRPAAGEVRP